MIASSLFDKVLVRDKLEEVATRIEENDQSAAERLRELGDAIGGSSSYSDAWAASDLHQIINVPAIIEHFRRQPIKDGIISIVEFARNVLIFAPLVVTWFGISGAVSAYGDLVQKDIQKSQLPFILLWQQGFDGRLTGLQSFSVIATLDFVILFIVLVLTAIASWLSSFAQQRREKQALQLEDTLNHALAGARLCLTTKNWAQPTNFVTRFDQAIESFKKVVNELVGQIKDERDAIATLAERQSEETKLFSTFKNELHGSMDGVTRSVTQMNTATNTLTQNIDLLRNSVNVLSSPVDTIAAQQEAVIQSFAQSITLLKSQVNSQTEITKQQEQWGTDLRNVLTTLQETVRRSVNEGSDLTDAVKELHEQYHGYLDLMRKEHESQKEITNNIFEASDKLGTTVELLDRWHTELNGINVQMSDFIDRLGDFVDRFGGGRVSSKP